MPLVPAPSPAAAGSSGHGGPFADMMGAFMQAGMEHMGISAMPSRGGVRDASPTLTFGPFNRIPSTISIRSEASHAPTERDAPHDDQLGKSEGDMAAARIRVKPCRCPWRGPTSESNPTVAPEPVVPKPKGKARKGRKAVAKAKVKAVAAERKLRLRSDRQQRRSQNDRQQHPPSSINSISMLGWTRTLHGSRPEMNPAATISYAGSTTEPERLAFRSLSEGKLPRSTTRCTTSAESAHIDDAIG